MALRPCNYLLPTVLLVRLAAGGAGQTGPLDLLVHLVPGLYTNQIEGIQEGLSKLGKGNNSRAGRNLGGRSMILEIQADSLIYRVVKLGSSCKFLVYS